MKKPLFVLLPLLTISLTGCAQLKEVFNALKSVDLSPDSEEREEGGREGFEQAINLINQKNYFMTYSSQISGAAFAVYYEIDGNKVKLGDNYYDYSSATEDGYAWEYIYDDEYDRYEKSMEDLSEKPASSRYLTRDTLSAGNYQYNEEKKCYEMISSKLSEYGFTYSSITISMDKDKVKTVYVDTRVPLENADHSATYAATLNRFGEASVTLPTNIIEI